MKRIFTFLLALVLATTSSNLAANAWTEKSGKAGFNSRYAQLITYYSPKYGTFEKLSNMSKAKLRAAGYWSLTLECDEKEEELNAFIMKYNGYGNAQYMSPTDNDFIDFELDGVEGYLSGYNSTNFKAVFLSSSFYTGDFESPYLYDEPAPEDEYWDPELVQYGTFYDWEKSKKIQFKIYLASGSIEYPVFSLAKLTQQKKKLTALGCGAYFDRYF